MTHIDIKHAVYFHRQMEMTIRSEPIIIKERVPTWQAHAVAKEGSRRVFPPG